MPYNPKAPSISGLEWRVDTERAVQVTAGGNACGVMVNATAAGVVTAAGFYLSAADSGGAVGNLVCDVYDMGAVPVYPASYTTPTVTTIVPKADHWNNGNVQSINNPSGTANAWVTQSPPGVPTYDPEPGGVWGGVSGRSWHYMDGGTGGTVCATLRDWNLVPFVRYPGEIGISYKFDATALGALAGRRIQNVAVATTVANPSAFVARIATGIEPLAAPYGDSISWRDLGGSMPGQTFTEYVGTWGINPVTRWPWSLTDVQSFSTASMSSGLSGWLRASAYGTGATTVGYLPLFTSCLLRVTHTPENRVATGVLSITAGQTGWRSIPLTNATGVGTFSRAAGHRYLFALRGSYDAAGDWISGMPLGGYAYPSSRPSVTVNALDSHDTVCFPGSYDMGLAPNAAPLYVTTPPVLTRAPSIAVISGGATSESQVYVDLYARAVSTAGVSAQQDLRSGSALTFGVVKATLGWDRGIEPTQALLVRIVNRGTSAVLGMGTLTVATAKALDFGGGNPIVATIEIPGGAAVPASTQVYIEFYTATAGSTWLAYGLDDGGGTYSAANYGAGTDTERYAGATNNTKDLLATMAVIPGAPTLAAATIV